MDISVLTAELSAIKTKSAETITAAKSANRDLTLAEATQLEQAADRIVALKGQITGAKNAAILGQFDGQTVIEEDPSMGRTVSAKGFVTQSAIKRMVATSMASGAKALVESGSSITPVAMDSNPIKLAGPTANAGLLDLIQTKVRDTPSYSYVRQTVRTNNAAVVAAGGQKPTSVFTLKEVTNTLDVVAHMSEYISTYLLEDNDNLEAFLSGELRDGIFAKVASLAVAEFKGTVGIQTQDFDNNPMDSIYLGVSKASASGYNPDMVMLSRETFDEITLAKDLDGNYLYKRAEDGRLSGLVPVIVAGLDTDTALVIDSSKVGISIDKQGIKTKWDAISRFDYNEARALVEGRFAFDVFAAPAIVEVTVASGS